MHESQRRVKAGLFTLAGLGVLVGGGFLFGKVSFSARQAFVVDFYKESVKGLNRGSPVFCQGITVGRVKNKELIGGGAVRVTIEIEERYVREGLVSEDEVAAQLSSDLLSQQRSVNLLREPSAGKRGSGRIESRASEAASLMESAGRSLETLDGTLKEMKRLIEQKEFQAVIENTNKGIEEVRALTREATAFLHENRKAFQEGLLGFQSATQEMRTSFAEFRGTLEDLRKSTVPSLEGAFKEFQVFAQDLRKSVSTIERQLDLFEKRGLPRLEEGFKSFTKVLDQVDRFLEANRSEVRGGLSELTQLLSGLKDLVELLRQQPSLLLRGAPVAPREEP